MRILLVEDSYKLADTLSASLLKEKHIVDIAYDGKTGYEYAISGIYDIAIFDLMLPLLSGYEILQKLRDARNPLPVLILSAKSELDDKVQAFEYGADDYMTKPFEIKELLMRIRAISRRRGETLLSVLSCGTAELNLNTCELFNTHTGESMKLAGKEFQLTEYLFHNQAQIITKEQITEKIWGYDSNSEYNNVEVYISFLRKKIAFIHANIQIRTLRGIGYILEVIT